MEPNQQVPQVETPIPQSIAEAPQKKSRSKLLWILLTLVLLVVVGAGAYYLGEKKGTVQKPMVVKPTVVPTSTLIPSGLPTTTLNTQSSIIDTGIVNQKKYVSPKLGISFLFSSVSNDMNVEVKEEGNKIFVYNKGANPSSGQWVEVFQKQAGDTLEQAVQKQFLANFSSKDCFVEDSQAGLNINPPSSYQFKTIGYPVPTNSEAPWFVNSDKCPVGYTKTNGLSYFLGDTKHSKLFLFFSIGQYGILAEEGTNKVWQNTIEFLN